MWEKLIASRYSNELIKWSIIHKVHKLLPLEILAKNQVELLLMCPT